MTDDRNGEEQRPSTRRMEPIDPAAGPDGYPEESYQQPYPQEPYGAAGPQGPDPQAGPPYESGAPGPDAYSSAQPYGNAPYGSDPYAGDPYSAYDEAEPPSKSNTGRTVLLSLLTLLALILLVLAVVLVYRGVNGADEAVDSPGATTSATAESSATTSAATSSSETTTTTTSTPAGTPTTVTYHFTGNGGLVAVNYRSESGNTVVATAGAPWSVQASVGSGERAELTGIVVSGQVTCQIKMGDTVIAESTGNGGPISCRATVPND